MISRATTFLRATALPVRTLRTRPTALNSRHLCARQLHSSSRTFSGLTNMLADGQAPAVQVKTITQDGIELVDGLLLPSACVFLNGRVFLWDVPSGGTDGNWDGWTNEMFEVFDVVVPKPEILLIGTGKSAHLLPPALRKHLMTMGVQTDIMDTWNACSTYNLLAEEGRRVAAALLPSWPEKKWKV